MAGVTAGCKVELEDGRQALRVTLTPERAASMSDWFRRASKGRFSDFAFFIDGWQLRFTVKKLTEN